MKLIFIKYTIVVLLFGLGLLAQAGRETGGGDVFICKEIYGRQTEERVYLVDTYEHFKTRKIGLYGVIRIEDIKILSAFNYREFLSAFLAAEAVHVPANAELYRSIIDQFKLVDNRNLPELEDDIHYTPTGCKKVQLAIQDLSNYEIQYRKDLFEQLSEVEKALFFQHEAFIKAHGNLPNQSPYRLRKFLYELTMDRTFAERLAAHYVTKKSLQSQPPEFHAGSRKFSQLSARTRDAYKRELKRCLPSYVNFLKYVVIKIEGSVAEEKLSYLIALDMFSFSGETNVTKFLEKTLLEYQAETEATPDNCAMVSGESISLRESQTLGDMIIEIAVYEEILNLLTDKKRKQKMVDEALDAFLLSLDYEATEEEVFIPESVRANTCSVSVNWQTKHEGDRFWDAPTIRFDCD